MRDEKLNNLDDNSECSPIVLFRKNNFYNMGFTGMYHKAQTGHKDFLEAVYCHLLIIVTTYFSWLSSGPDSKLY